MQEQQPMQQPTPPPAQELPSQPQQPPRPMAWPEQQSAPSAWGWTSAPAAGSPPTGATQQSSEVDDVD